MVDAYYFCLGAPWANMPVRAPSRISVRGSEVPEAIERILRNYMELRDPAENLRQFFARPLRE